MNQLDADGRTAVETPTDVESASSYGRGARLLSIGIAATGVATFAYFSLASYALTGRDYKHVTVLWSVMFIVCSVIYRPIEQLLSRTIASRRARGLTSGHPLRVPMTIQAGFALTFLALALIARHRLQQDLFDGATALYWVLVVGVMAYAASYFARGWLAGNQKFGLYGGLVFLEAVSRCLFALAVIVGVASGQSAVALGIAAAPLVSLVVVPLAFRRHEPRSSAGGTPAAAEEGLSLARGGRFAVSVLAIVAAEQALLNSAVLIINATSTNAAVAGFAFNALLIARAPLQLFQAVQGALLPHLAGLDATDSTGEFGRAVRLTVVAILAFAGTVAAGLLVLGPFAMRLLFGNDGYTYGRLGLAVVALGMGLHLTAGTLNQAALARDHAGYAAFAWLVSAAAMIGFVATDVVSDDVLRAEVAYTGAAALLCVLLTVVYLRPPGRHPGDVRPLLTGEA